MAGPRATIPPAATLASRALTPDEQLFTKLIGQVGTAIEKRDMTVLNPLIAPEYVHYNPGNGRAEELAYLGTWTATAVEVNRYGNAASTVSTFNFSGVAEGKPVSSTLQMMITWVLRAGRWQMTVIQAELLTSY